MTRKITIAALVLLLSLTGCVIVPYGSGQYYHGWHHDHHWDYRR
jgi:hypothetical protein